MNKFFEWRKAKYYDVITFLPSDKNNIRIENGDLIATFYSSEQGDPNNDYKLCGMTVGLIPNQMMIGYMIEYLWEKEIKWWLDYSCRIDSIYNALKQKIEELQ